MDAERARREYARRINLAIDFIGAHLTENPSLDEIAAAASFSKFHFHRIFHAYVGETVAAFTRRLRLERAANELRFNVDKDITSIALDCGFSSSQNFAKAFKGHFHMSPTAYRTGDHQLRTPLEAHVGGEVRKDGNVRGKDGNACRADPGHGHPPLTSERQPHQEQTMTLPVDINDIPDKHVAYVRTIGAYEFERAKAAWIELSGWAAPRGLMEDSEWIGIAWDNPGVTPAEKCRYDACITVPEDTAVKGGVALQTVPGGRYAVYRNTVVGNDFQAGWDRLVGDWLPQSGFQCDHGPAYELMIESGADDPGGRWVVDLHLPVKPL